MGAFIGAALDMQSGNHSPIDLRDPSVRTAQRAADFGIGVKTFLLASVGHPPSGRHLAVCDATRVVRKASRR